MCDYMVSHKSHDGEGYYTCGKQIYSIISIRPNLDNACKTIYQVLGDNYQSEYKSPI